MTEAQLYEALGRKQASLELAEANFDTALKCMAAMVSGEMALSRVHVDVAGRSFHWTAEESQNGHNRVSDLLSKG